VTRTAEATVERVDVSARTIPTEEPESDGTLEWNSTTIVLVQVYAAGKVGLGYTYAHDAAAWLIEDKLAPIVRNCDPMDVERAWHAMSRALRNIGRPGLGFMALSAVDIALWDLKARLLDEPLIVVLGASRDEVPIYGSGGFCSYSDQHLERQLAGWVEQGIPRVKMKIGREPERDPVRVRAAGRAIGGDAELFVDANGAFTREEAVQLVDVVHADDDAPLITWFEEPVSSDDLHGLRALRDELPSWMEVAAGEYGDTPAYFERMLEARAVDCLQADVTRCGGITGLLRIAPLAHTHELDLSAHCAPAISAHAFCAVGRLRHLEYFHDHVRVEGMIFDGVPVPDRDVLRPDQSRPGHGLELKA
jgi:L-alanine-DL-glutamate epimerase-like enolase superfamily enzyme